MMVLPFIGRNSAVSSSMPGALTTEVIDWPTLVELALGSFNHLSVTPLVDRYGWTEYLYPLCEKWL
jgi:hypothetical protein